MKVRFNLGRGERFQKWKVDAGKEPEFYDPNKSSLSLVNCRLMNVSSKAEKIHQGAHKSVCAWIQCDWLKEIPTQNSEKLTEVFYNPRIAPYWRDEDGNNIDGQFFSRLITMNYLKS